MVQSLSEEREIGFANVKGCNNRMIGDTQIGTQSLVYGAWCQADPFVIMCERLRVDGVSDVSFVAAANHPVSGDTRRHHLDCWIIRPLISQIGTRVRHDAGSMLGRKDGNLGTGVLHVDRVDEELARGS